MNANDGIRQRLRTFLDLLARANDDSPMAFETVLPGGAGAHGMLCQWTCDDGHVETQERVAAGVATPYSPEDACGLAHVGEMVTALYVARGATDDGKLAWARFENGERMYVYVRDCCFD